MAPRVAVIANACFGKQPSQQCVDIQNTAGPSRPVLRDVVINRRRKRQSSEKQLQKKDNAAAAVDKPTVICEPRRSRRLSALAAAATAMQHQSGAVDIHVKRQQNKTSRKSQQKEDQEPNNTSETAKSKSSIQNKYTEQLQLQQRNAPSKKRKLNDPTTDPDTSSTDSMETKNQLSKTLSTSDAKTEAAPTHSITTRGTCIDFLSDAHHNLVLEPFDATKLTAGISYYDRANRGKILLSPEYVTDIFQRLYDCETRLSPRPYMECQPDMQPSMRAILVDWMVEAHAKFRCVPEVLHLGVNLLDRYLNVAEVARKEIQLVGITALWIAAKYEEVYPFQLKDCVTVTGRAYTKQQILDMEVDMLDGLRFQLTVPTGYQFLQRFLSITKSTPLMQIAATFYLERTLQEYDVLGYRQSEIAMAAVVLAINHPEIREVDLRGQEDKPGVPQELMDYTGFSASDTYKIADFVAKKVSVDHETSGGQGHLNAVKRKYAVDRYMNISTQFAHPDAIDLIDD